MHNNQTESCSLKPQDNDNWKFMLKTNQGTLNSGATFIFRNGD